MEASLILLCKYHGETCGIRVFQSSTFGQLMDKLSSRWSCLKSTAVRLCYSFSGDPFCLLQNDDDLEVMLDLVLRSGGHQVHVSVLDGGSSSSRGSTSIDTSSTGSELAVCRRELKLQEDKEVDLLTSFCPNKETVLLSAGWCDLIKKVGQKFLGGVVEFREALSMYAIYFGFEYDFVKNDKERVTAVCRKKNSGCPWMVHGRTVHLSGIFFIRKLENVHNCGASVLKLRHSRATSSLVGKLVVDEIRSQPLKRPVDVVADLKRLYGVSITYNRAWMGVEKAKADAFGDYSTSFDDLRWWVDAARISNPESVFDIEYHVDTNRFSRLFVAFHACISGFNHCRPILFVDGTFLKARHKGCLLAASGKDGNQGKL